jgi:hypothetical protein
MRRQFALLLFVVLLSVPVVSQERGHSIKGFVRDEGTQAATSSASVEITMSGSRAAPSHQSGMNGEFTINGLRDGDYYISATKRTMNQRPYRSAWE